MILEIENISTEDLQNLFAVVTTSCPPERVNRATKRIWGRLEGPGVPRGRLGLENVACGLSCGSVRRFWSRGPRRFCPDGRKRGGADGN